MDLGVTETLVPIPDPLLSSWAVLGNSPSASSASNQLWEKGKAI